MKILFILLIMVFVPVQATYAFEQGNMTNMIPNGTANMSDFVGNATTLEPPAPSDFVVDANSGAEPPDMVDMADMNCNTSDYPSTACDIVHDLISLPAVGVRDYGLSAQPHFVIKQTLNLLDPGNLTKVLQNIPLEELSIIRDKLTPQTFNTTLSRVPEPERDQIINKLSLN